MDIVLYPALNPVTTPVGGSGLIAVFEGGELKKISVSDFLGNLTSDITTTGAFSCSSGNAKINSLGQLLLYDTGVVKVALAPVGLSFFAHGFNVNGLSAMLEDGTAVFGGVATFSQGLLIPSAIALNADGSFSAASGAVTVDASGNAIFLSLSLNDDLEMNDHSINDVGNLYVGGLLTPRGGISTIEGDTFYPHTVAGNLVWTTSP